ncbi:hypothetical protein CI109_102686 [Kwoniella shandongensis]|uniref:Uncharacterized protein n=1 Tax=Kwoniella shandongensis TaxID=1734106 RepID=A0A5M6BPA8_9TREE|nr:uncharacterized protein CI109_007114 [Kwoniella shandongensis]KAA5524567.1 hypothetical protein CI109_007114 [Kwoniella shandongensis]
MNIPFGAARTAFPRTFASGGFGGFRPNMSTGATSSPYSRFFTQQPQPPPPQTSSPFSRFFSRQPPPQFSTNPYIPYSQYRPGINTNTYRSAFTNGQPSWAQPGGHRFPVYTATPKVVFRPTARGQAILESKGFRNSSPIPDWWKSRLAQAGMGSFVRVTAPSKWTVTRPEVVGILRNQGIDLNAAPEGIWRQLETKGLARELDEDDNDEEEDEDEIGFDARELQILRSAQSLLRERNEHTPANMFKVLSQVGGPELAAKYARSFTGQSSTSSSSPWTSGGGGGGFPSSAAGAGGWGGLGGFGLPGGGYNPNLYVNNYDPLEESVLPGGIKIAPGKVIYSAQNFGRPPNAPSGTATSPGSPGNTTATGPATGTAGSTSTSATSAFWDQPFPRTETRAWKTVSGVNTRLRQTYSNIVESRKQRKTEEKRLEHLLGILRKSTEDGSAMRNGRAMMAGWKLVNNLAESIRGRTNKEEDETDNLTRLHTVKERIMTTIRDLTKAKMDLASGELSFDDAEETYWRPLRRKNGLISKEGSNGTSEDSPYDRLMRDLNRSRSRAQST